MQYRKTTADGGVPSMGGRLMRRAVDGKNFASRRRDGLGSREEHPRLVGEDATRSGERIKRGGEEMDGPIQARDGSSSDGAGGGEDESREGSWDAEIRDHIDSKFILPINDEIRIYREVRERLSWVEAHLSTADATHTQTMYALAHRASVLTAWCDIMKIRINVTNGQIC